MKYVVISESWRLTNCSHVTYTSFCTKLVSPFVTHHCPVSFDRFTFYTYMSFSDTLQYNLYRWDKETISIYELQLSLPANTPPSCLPEITVCRSMVKTKLTRCNVETRILNTKYVKPVSSMQMPSHQLLRYNFETSILGIILKLAS